MADDLRSYLAKKVPIAPALQVPAREDSARVMRAVLAAARAEWVKEATDPKEQSEREQSNFRRDKDDAGRHLDWHSLRHTRSVWLFQYNRCTPEEVQCLMGLASLSLVERYTRSFALDRSVVERNAGPVVSPDRDARRHEGNGHSRPAE